MALSAITAGLGILATILVIYRIIDVPDGGIPEGLGVDLLRAIAGDALLRRSYETALAAGYRWHEFGDSHLILP